MMLATVALYSVANDLAMGCAPVFVLSDTLLLLVLSAFMAVTVWNVLRYTFKIQTEAGRLSVMLLAMGAAWCLVGIGIEGAVLILISEDLLIIFKSMLLSRIAVMAMLFVIAELYVERILLMKQQNDDSEIPAEEIAVPTADEPEDQAPRKTLSQINVKSGQKLDIINIGDIIYLKADGDYVQIVTAQGHYLKDQTMKYYEQNLPSDMFVRVHRSYIVRLQAISRIERYGQMQQLELCNREKIRVSPSGYKALKERLNL